MHSQEVDDVLGAGAALVLIFTGRWTSKRLTHVFLVNTPLYSAGGDSVVPGDDDGNLVLEFQDTRFCGREAERSGKLQADVLVLGVTMKGVVGGLQYVGRWNSA